MAGSVLNNTKGSFRAYRCLEILHEILHQCREQVYGQQKKQNVEMLEFTMCCYNSRTKRLVLLYW